jgi:hypothetical protein
MSYKLNYSSLPSNFSNNSIGAIIPGAYQDFSAGISVFPSGTPTLLFSISVPNGIYMFNSVINLSSDAASSNAFTGSTTLTLNNTVISYAVSDFTSTAPGISPVGSLSNCHVFPVTTTTSTIAFNITDGAGEDPIASGSWSLTRIA